MTLNNFNAASRFRRFGIALSLSFFVTSMNGCDGISWNESDQALEVQSKGKIRVLTLRHPLVDESAKGGLSRGFERELLLHFAQTYGLQIQFIQKKTTSELLHSLQNGEGDIAAGRFWTRENRRLAFLQGPAFEESHLSLFCRRKLKVQHIQDLKYLKVVLFTKDNLDSYDQRIRWMVPSIHLRTENSDHMRRLFTQMQSGRVDCTFAENIEGHLNLRLFSKLMKVEEPMSGRRGLSWLIRNDRSDLASLMHAWFQRASREDEIMRIRDLHRAHALELSRQDAKQFFMRLNSRMGSYRQFFVHAAKAQNLDWKWVASVAYQESHWNPDARSFTGVRGLMQLTHETAKAVGIEDRNDPKQSIWGGAFYLRFLMNRMPKNIDAQERMALTLAAYNSGLGHLRSAQALALQRGLNPYSWRHVRQVYPLLEDPKIAATFPHGVARGRETVDYVDRVRGFYQLWKLIEY